MAKIKDEAPFIYTRGRCRIEGSTDKDRKVLRLEIILHWIWKIILALSLLGGTVHTAMNIKDIKKSIFNTP